MTGSSESTVESGLNTGSRTLRPNSSTSDRLEELQVEVTGVSLRMNLGDRDKGISLDPIAGNKREVYFDVGVLLLKRSLTASCTSKTGSYGLATEMKARQSVWVFRDWKRMPPSARGFFKSCSSALSASSMESPMSCVSSEAAGMLLLPSGGMEGYRRSAIWHGI